MGQRTLVVRSDRTRRKSLSPDSLPPTLPQVPAPRELPGRVRASLCALHLGRLQRPRGTGQTSPSARVARSDPPDRRQVVRAETMGERDREGGRLVDADSDEAGGQAGLRGSDPARDRDEARERAGRHVDHEQLDQAAGRRRRRDTPPRVRARRAPPSRRCLRRARCACLGPAQRPRGSTTRRAPRGRPSRAATARPARRTTIGDEREHDHPDRHDPRARRSRLRSCRCRSRRRAAASSTSTSSTIVSDSLSTAPAATRLAGWGAHPLQEAHADRDAARPSSGTVRLMNLIGRLRGRRTAGAAAASTPPRGARSPTSRT